MLKKLFFLLFIFASVQSLSQNPQGFFLDDFQPRAAAVPAFEEFEKPSESATTFVNVDFTNVVTPVSPYLFGNNANIWMTQMVDQTSLINDITTLSPGIIRFPGGSISGVYFWDAEKDQPPDDAPAQIPNADGVMQNAGYWYGKNSESWTMSLENYYQMLEMTNSTGMITVNYDYARYSTAPDPVASAAHLAAEWVRHDNGRTKFWEIGNECNGSWQAGFRINTVTNQDGQPLLVNGELYGDHFKVFADSMRKAADDVGATIYIGAHLLAEAPANWWNDTDRYWNDGVFAKAGDVPDFYIIHSYYTPYQANSSAADVLNSAMSVTEDMMDFVTNAISDAGLTPKPIALTEWNIFAEGSKQQVSFINGMHATLVLGEVIRMGYGMAARWDLANDWGNGNDHGMFSQGGEPGVPKWNPRPAFYYMYYFKKYFGDHMVDASVSGSNDVVAYASSFDSGEAGLVVVNNGNSTQTVSINLQNFGYGERYYIYSLTGGTDNGQFSLKVFVNGRGTLFPAGGPANVENIPARSATIGSGIKFNASAKSVHYILVEHGDNVITGIEGIAGKGVSVHPNPARETFRIDVPVPGFFQMEMTDPTGKMIQSYSLDPSKTSFEVKSFTAPGLYILRLHGGNGVTRTKIVIE